MKPTALSTVVTRIWARGKRARRLRAAAFAATLLGVLGAVGTGIGVRLADGDGNRSAPAPAGTVGFALPIEYPVGEKLPDLGGTPGPLAAIWLAPRVGGGAPEVVGLVAKTGMFGTLPIDLPDYLYRPKNPEAFPWAAVALSPDGRRIAYDNHDVGSKDLVVRDLVSGEEYAPASGSGIRVLDRWVDATHLLGHFAASSGAVGWLWEPGTAPKLVDFDTVPYGGTDLALRYQGGGPRECSSPSPRLQNLQTRKRYGGDQSAGAFDVPMLCDVMGITRSEILLGHWNSDRLPGDWNDPNDGNGTVVALDIHGDDQGCRPLQRCTLSFEDPARRHVVVTAGAPQRVAFAAYLIGQALDTNGGGS